MPLLLVDLDNTLIDRSGAVDRWAREFVRARGGDAADVRWLVAADGDGLESRDRLAALIGSRFGLDGRAEAGMLAELRGGLIDHIVLDRAVIGSHPAARPLTTFRPCYTADSFPHAVRIVLASGGRRPSLA